MVTVILLTIDCQDRSV